LDKLLRAEENSSAASTPYTAAIPAYRIVFTKPEDAAHINKSFSLSNGHVVYDIQHPCRYAFFLGFYATDSKTMVVVWANSKHASFPGQMWLCAGSFIHQLLTGPAFIWSLTLQELASRKHIE
jgi:hypothetical protein